MEVGAGKVKSLKIVRTPYIKLLNQDLPHRNYFDSFLCSQTPEICEDGPKRKDIKVSKSNLRFELPYPISKPEAKVMIEDPCFKLVNKKQAFRNKVEIAKRKYQYDKHWLTKSKIMKDKVKFVPEYFYELTHGKSADLDPYFNSSYDFYYTGGTICRLREGDDAVVIYTDNIGNIFCTNIKTTQTTSLTNLDGGTVYNIKSYANSHLLIRQKHEVNVVRVKLKRGKYSAKPVWNVNIPNVPLNDCDLFEDDEMCYTDMEQNLKILDMEREKCKYEHKFSQNGGDGLLQVKYLNGNVLSVMGRDYLSILDQRSTTCNNYSSEESFLKCNHYCAFCVSGCSDYYLYVGTKHNVLKFDMRRMEVVKKWTHFMDLDPNVIKTGRYDDGEVVCVSGFVDTVCFPTGEANYMPVRLINTKSAFDECRLKKKFMFREDLEERLGMGTVGMDFLENKSDFAVFTCNSIGDVFRHNLKTDLITEASGDVFSSWMLSFPNPKKSDEYRDKFNKDDGGDRSDHVSDENMDKFITWVDAVPEIAHPLYVTSVKNMKNAKKLLMKKRNVKLKKTVAPKLGPLMQFLEKYSDHNFANIWSTGQPIDAGGDLKTVTPQCKVSEWLESTENY